MAYAAAAGLLLALIHGTPAAALSRHNRGLLLSPSLECRAETAFFSTPAFSTISLSFDGTKRALADSHPQGYIYISTDSGYSWAQTTAGLGTGHPWAGVQCSRDCSRLAAYYTGGNIFTSSNSGASWTEQLGSGTHQWTGMAMSHDGSKLIAAAAGSFLFISTNAGVSWSQASGISSSWTTVAASADFTTLAAANNANIYVSKNSGQTWTVQQTNAGQSANWGAIAMASDASSLVAVAYGGNGVGTVYATKDLSTWAQLQGVGTGSESWTSLAMSADGSTIALADGGGNGGGGGGGGKVWLSTDGGSTWVAENNLLQPWQDVALSADGINLAAATNAGAVYSCAQTCSSPGNSITGGVCVPCSPGTYASSSSALECKACPVDTFSDKVGSSECDPCPVGSGTAGLTGRSQSTSCNVKSTSKETNTLGRLGLIGLVFVFAIVVARRRYFSRGCGRGGDGEGAVEIRDRDLEDDDGGLHIAEASTLSPSSPPVVQTTWSLSNSEHGAAPVPTAVPVAHYHSSL